MEKYVYRLKSRITKAEPFFERIIRKHLQEDRIMRVHTQLQLIELGMKYAIPVLIEYVKGAPDIDLSDEEDACVDTHDVLRDLYRKARISDNLLETLPLLVLNSLVRISHLIRFVV